MGCIFCDIIKGDIPSKKLFENEMVLAFQDIQPAAPVHVLVIPKKHIASIQEVSSQDMIYLSEIHRTAQKLAVDLGVAEAGYRLVTNCGPNGGQAVAHLHYHLLAGEKLGPLNA